MYFVVLTSSLLFMAADLSDWGDFLKVFLSRAPTEPRDPFKARAHLGGKGIHPFHQAIFQVE